MVRREGHGARPRRVQVRELHFIFRADLVADDLRGIGVTYVAATREDGSLSGLLASRRPRGPNGLKMPSLMELSRVDGVRRRTPHDTILLMSLNSFQSSSSASWSRKSGSNFGPPGIAKFSAFAVKKLRRSKRWK